MNYVVPTGVTQTQASPITDGSTGPSTVVKQGGGTLLLTADNTYTGDTEVQAGTLALGPGSTAGTSGSIADSQYLLVDSGATFDISTLTGPASVNSLQGAGAVTLGADTLADTQGSTGAVDFSGVISGTGGLTVSAASGASAGAATLELTGANTYTGATTIGAGATLQVGSGGTTGSLASAQINGAGTLAFDETGNIYFGATFGFPGVSIEQLGSGTLSLSQTDYGVVTIVHGTVALVGVENGYQTGTGPTSVSAQIGAGATLDLTGDNQEYGANYGQFEGIDVEVNNPSSGSGGTVDLGSGAEADIYLYNSNFSGAIHGAPTEIEIQNVTLSGTASDFTTSISLTGLLHLESVSAAGNLGNTINLSTNSGGAVYQFGILELDSSTLTNGVFGHPVTSRIDSGIIDLTGLAYSTGATAQGSGTYGANGGNTWSAITVTSGGVTDTINGSFQDSLTGRYFVQPDGQGGTEVVVADYIAPVTTEAGLDQAFSDFSLYAPNGGAFDLTLASNVNVSSALTELYVQAGDRIVIDGQGHAIIDPSGALVIGNGSTIDGAASGVVVLGESSTGTPAANVFGNGVSIYDGLLELASAGAAGSAGITFAEAVTPSSEYNYAPGQTPNTLLEPQTGIQLDQVNGQTIALPNTLYGFSLGDAVILSGETITGLSLGSGNVVTVTEQGGATVTLHFNPSQSFAGEAFGYINTATGGEVGLFAPVTYEQYNPFTEYATTTGDALTGDLTYDPQSSGLSVSSVSSGYSGASHAVGSGQTNLQGAYGVLTITAGGGYNYTTDVEGLTVGQTYTDTFTATVADGQGGLTPETLSFMVTGSATGTAANNIIVGGSGAAETITGLGGADLLIAGSAPDTFVYTSATDSPYSTSGTPTFDAIEGFRSGTDHINVSATDGGGVELVRVDSGSTPETFVYFDPGGAAGYQDVVEVYGVVQPGDLTTSSAVSYVYDYGDKAAGQVLDGTSGHDFLVAGGASSDSLLAGPDDVMYGGAGVDDFVVGALADSSATGAFDVIADFTSGQDKLDLSAVSGVGVEIAYYHGDAFVYFSPSGGAFQGVVEVLGAVTPDDLGLSAAAQSNGVVIQGDTTLAATASETLRGGSKGDFIYGGSAHDTIIGGGGADFLIGGTGADTFAYTAITDSTPTAQDTISNFDPAKNDLIDVSALDSAAGVKGSFVSAFDGHAGEYILTAPTGSGSNWSLQGDLTGSGHADFQLAFAVAGAVTDYQDVQAHIHL